MDGIEVTSLDTRSTEFQMPVYCKNKYRAGGHLLEKDSFVKLVLSNPLLKS